MWAYTPFCFIRTVFIRTSRLGLAKTLRTWAPVARIFVMSQIIFHWLKKKQTRITFRKLVELVLFVLSFIQNYDLLKCFSINLKNIGKNVSGSNRQKK